MYELLGTIGTGEGIWSLPVETFATYEAAVFTMERLAETHDGSAFHLEVWHNGRMVLDLARDY